MDEKRWVCSETQIQHWEDRCVLCFPHYRFPLQYSYSKLLITVDTHILRHPQSLSVETGGPLTAHNVGSIQPYPVQCWWHGNRKICQLENSKTRTERAKLRPTTKLRQKALLSTSTAVTEESEGFRLIQDSFAYKVDAAITQQLNSTAIFLSCFLYS